MNDRSKPRHEVQKKEKAFDERNDLIFKANDQQSTRQMNEMADDNSNIVISKMAFSDLSDQIALSLDKMRLLEEQVRIIPELQKRIACMMPTQTINPCDNPTINRLDDDHDSVDCLSNSSFGTDRLHQRRLTEQNLKRPVTNENLDPRKTHLQNIDIANRPMQISNQRFVTSSTFCSTPYRQQSNNPNLDTPSVCSRNEGINEQTYHFETMTPQTGAGASIAQKTFSKPSDPKFEYDDLLNDLISLSYSVNYPSHVSERGNSSNHSAAASKSSSVQTLDGCVPNVTQVAMSPHVQNSSHFRQQRGITVKPLSMITHHRNLPQDHQQQQRLLMNENDHINIGDSLNNCSSNSVYSRSSFERKLSNIPNFDKRFYQSQDCNSIASSGQERNLTTTRSTTHSNDFMNDGQSPMKSKLAIDKVTREIHPRIQQTIPSSNYSRRQQQQKAETYNRYMIGSPTFRSNNKSPQSPKPRIPTMISTCNRQQQQRAINHTPNHYRHQESQSSNSTNDNTAYISHNTTKSSGYTSLTRQSTYLIESSSRLSTPDQRSMNGEDQNQTQNPNRESITPTQSSTRQLLYDRMRYKQPVLASSNSTSISTRTTPVKNIKNMVDSSTMTELTLDNIVTKGELDSILANARNADCAVNTNTYTSRTCSYSGDDNVTRRVDSIRQELSQLQNQCPSSTGQRSSSSLSPQNSTDFYEDARVCDEDANRANNEQNMNPILSLSSTSTSSSSSSSPLQSPLDELKNELHAKTSIKGENQKCNLLNDNQNSGETNKSDNTNINNNQNSNDLDDDHSTKSSNEDTAAEPFSLGSSYQDPSDFEEYYSYDAIGGSKEISYYANKIPNQFRLAVGRLHSLMNSHSDDKNATYKSLLENIRQEWFDVVSNKESKVGKTKLYVDYYESFDKNLTNIVVNVSDNAGNTAVHYAASNYRLDLISVLLETNVCDVNCRNKAGYTPIMLLALMEISNPIDADIARKIFIIGDVNLRSRSSGQTALMLASSHGRTNTSRILLECGADPSIRDYEGSTALMCASEMGHEEIVKCLLDHPLTDACAVDNDGLDALSIAMNNGHDRITAALYKIIGPKQQRAIGSYRSSMRSSFNRHSVSRRQQTADKVACSTENGSSRRNETNNNNNAHLSPRRNESLRSSSRIPNLVQIKKRDISY